MKNRGEDLSARVDDASSPAETAGVTQRWDESRDRPLVESLRWADSLFDGRPDLEVSDDLVRSVVSAVRPPSRPREAVLQMVQKVGWMVERFKVQRLAFPVIVTVLLVVALLVWSELASNSTGLIRRGEVALVSPGADSDQSPPVGPQMARGGTLIETPPDRVWVAQLDNEGRLELGERSRLRVAGVQPTLDLDLLAGRCRIVVGGRCRLQSNAGTIWADGAEFEAWCTGSEGKESLHAHVMCGNVALLGWSDDLLLLGPGEEGMVSAIRPATEFSVANVDSANGGPTFPPTRALVADNGFFGRVLTTDGRFAEGAAVELYPYPLIAGSHGTHRLPETPAATCRAAPGGVYRFHESREGVYLLLARHERFGAGCVGPVRVRGKGIEMIPEMRLVPPLPRSGRVETVLHDVVADATVSVVVTLRCGALGVPFQETVRTDSSGRYSAPSALEGEGKVIVWAPGWAPSLSTLGTTQSQADVTMFLGRAVWGRVADRAGLPIPGAEVTWARDGWVLLRTLADQDGFFRFTHAPNQGGDILCRVPGSACPPVDAGEAPLRKEYKEIEARGVRTIIGSVVDNTGQPLPEAKIHWGERGDSGRPGQISLWPEVVRTDENGRFRLESIPRVPVWLAAETGDGRVVVTHCDPARNEVTLEAGSVAEICGEVVNSSGRPITAAAVTIRSLDGNQVDTGTSVLTDQFGRFRITVPAERVAEIDVFLPGYRVVGPRKVRLPAQKDLSFVMRPEAEDGWNTE